MDDAPRSPACCSQPIAHIHMCTPERALEVLRETRVATSKHPRAARPLSHTLCHPLNSTF
jgi:hypothetical protein